MLYRLSYMGRLVCLLPVLLLACLAFGLPKLERVMGIEPTSSAWKAEVLPLNYTRRDLSLPSHFLALHKRFPVASKPSVCCFASR